MAQKQPCSWLIWFGFLLVSLALNLTTDLLAFRHSTMAIGIAVYILGCTGTLEDRAATLSKIIQVAVELKDSMGDLYSFSALMKALEMPQITRLEKTWTALRHQYTQTAILYEKQLKPFSKILHEGRGEHVGRASMGLPCWGVEYKYKGHVMRP